MDQNTPTLNHPEWEKTNSLTSPLDRGDNVYKSDLKSPALTEDEATNAVASLVHNDFVAKFPKIERQYADPPIHLQTYGLVSFVPAKGATPDKEGVYGFAKIRGNYATEIEAFERCEYLIRNVDSYHGIFTAYVGRPFPITVDQKYARDNNEIDIRKKATDTIAEDVRAKREQEKKDIEEVKQREKRLLDESKEDYVPDPMERYTVLRVKKAQLTWGYSQTMKQLENMKGIIIKTREEIKALDEENPDFQKTYFEKYIQARREAGISDDHNTEENFVKYMVEDLDLGF
jgi:hypothetical protein